MAILRGLQKDSEQWKPAGCPLPAMMDIERRHATNVPVITKALTELNSPCFTAYASMREMWSLNDCFVSPGPIQFAGVAENALTYLIKPPSQEELASVTDEECKGNTFAPKHETNLSPLGLARLEEVAEIPEIFSDGLD